MVTGLLLVYAVFFGVLLSNLLYLRRTRTERDPAQTPTVSILVPARNEATNLTRLLPTLLAQDYPAYEVIVYDDGSTDGTPALLSAWRHERLRVVRGEGPPPGWLGKVFALYSATRDATGEVFLFLDADTRLTNPGALRRLVRRYAALPASPVLSGLPAYRGGAGLLVSMVPFVLLTQLPWSLVRRTRAASLSALNGQCWMIDAHTYRRLEPHAHVRDRILEDVEIGRYLKRCGHTPVLADVQREVEVYMYTGLTDAWRGFRKNVYLLMGGRLLTYVPAFAGFAAVFVLAPLLSPYLLGALYLLKGATDRLCRFPAWVTMLAPLSFLLAALLQLDSAYHHLTRRVSWKDRRVGPQ